MGERIRHASKEHEVQQPKECQPSPVSQRQNFSAVRCVKISKMDGGR